MAPCPLLLLSCLLVSPRKTSLCPPVSLWRFTGSFVFQLLNNDQSCHIRQFYFKHETFLPYSHCSFIFGSTTSSSKSQIHFVNVHKVCVWLFPSSRGVLHPHLENLEIRGNLKIILSRGWRVLHPSAGQGCWWLPEEFSLPFSIVEAATEGFPPPSASTDPQSQGNSSSCFCGFPLSLLWLESYAI